MSGPDKAPPRHVVVTAGDRPPVSSPDPDLHVLQHALGLDGHGRGVAYRNHYVAEPGHHGWDACMRHVEAGRMVRSGPHPTLCGGAYSFRVTEAGRQHVAEHSPQPPRLSRSQRRYLDWLHADCGMPFGDWLKSARSRA